MIRRICPECEKTSDRETCPNCGNPTVVESLLGQGDDPFIGKTLGERYRVESLLGRGGMGRVYLAEQVAMKRKVALKVIRSQDSEDKAERMSMLKRFQREALAASRLGHHNTVRVFDFGLAEDGTLYLAMELLQGLTLSKVMREGLMPPKRAIRIAVQICKSLAEAHANGIIHRDLKPDNVMLADAAGDKDFVKVLDFGIAKIATGTGESSVTRTGMVVGTPAYMAPEQASGTGVTAATDLYALGAILYEALSGRQPFTAETPLALLVKKASQEVPPLVAEGMPPGVPQALVDIVLRLLERVPERRPRSAMELAEQLESVDLSGPIAVGCGGDLAGRSAMDASTEAPPATARLGSSPVGAAGRMAVTGERSSTVETALQSRSRRWWWVLGAAGLVAGVSVGALLWADYASSGWSPEPATVTGLATPVTDPVLAQPVPVVAPASTTAEPARAVAAMAPRPAAEVPPATPPPASAAARPPAREHGTASRRAPSVDRKQGLPPCVRSGCPISGDCTDNEGRRISGQVFCRDVEI